MRTPSDSGGHGFVSMCAHQKQAETYSTPLHMSHIHGVPECPDWQESDLHKPHARCNSGNTQVSERSWAPRDEFKTAKQTSSKPDRSNRLRQEMNSLRIWARGGPDRPGNAA